MSTKGIPFVQNSNGFHNASSEGNLVVKKRKVEQPSTCDIKVAAFASIGFITLLYVVAELAAGIYVDSLVLLSDGFHNLSDVISLYIAYWAQQAQKRDLSDEMSYGWVRSEILGGLTNGCFLLAICLYVVLESIPKFIDPHPIEAGFIFIIVAATGLAVNTIGTIVFCLTGQSHGHSHSHGGGGGGHGGHSHGHSHSHDKKKNKNKEDHGHSHGHKDKEKKKEKKEEESLLIINDNGDDKEHKEHKEHKEGKEKKEKKKEGHGHSHGHKDKKEKKKPRKDLNVHAVFLHYLGDAISSLMVLVSGIFIHFYKGHTWSNYIDPVSSLIIVGLILWTTLPLVKRCSMILMQSTPTEIELEKLRNSLLRVEGLLSIHDFHVWQLVDGMIIASIHVSVEEGVDFTALVSEVKRIFHEYGIHSSAIQPEYVPRNFQDSSFCEQNCVKECDEDWCCKKTAQKKKAEIEQFSISTEV